MGDIFPLRAVNQQRISLRFLYVNCAREMIMKVYSQANNTTSSPDQQAKVICWFSKVAFSIISQGS